MIAAGRPGTRRPGARFLVLALNTSGVFEITPLVPSSAASWSARNLYVDAALGRNGVPVCVRYRPGREPLLLPEVLNKQLVAGRAGDAMDQRARIMARAASSARSMRSCVGGCELR